MNNNISENSEKRKRFQRLAEYRTNQVLKRLDVLANCANKNNYEYTKEEVDKIFREINKKVSVVKNKFKASQKNKEDNRFKL